jgi:HK97 family phage major capsid protein
MWIELLTDLLGQKAGARIDVCDADARLLIDAKKAQAVNNDPIVEAVQKSMAEALGKITGSISGAVDAAMKDFGSSLAKSRRNAVPAIFGENGHGDPKKTFGAFLLAIQQKNVKALEEMGSFYVDWERPIDKKTAMTTQQGAQGGFAVPTEFYDRLMTLVTERSVIRPRATVLPMSSKEMEVPCLDHTTAPSAGDTAFLGGLIARWTEESTSGSNLQETEPNLKQIKLINYELSGYSKISNALLADNAVGLDALLMKLFSAAIAWYEDYAFLRGTGAGRPLGMLAWAGLISVTRSAASACSLADVAGMYGRLLPAASMDSVIWVIHPTILTKLLTMTGGDNVIFLGNDVTGRPRWQILGHDVVVTEKVPALNTAGDILLADCAQYLIGDRQQVEIAFSEHVAFTTNQSVWRFVSRVAGMPWLRDKVTLSDATNTLSPFVALAAG